MNPHAHICTIASRLAGRGLSTLMMALALLTTIQTKSQAQLVTPAAKETAKEEDELPTFTITEQQANA